MKKYIIGTIIAMALITVAGYYDRGYWAVGPEIMLPAIAYIHYLMKKSLN